MFRRTCRFGVLLLFVLIPLVACSETAKPTVVIVSPPSGSQVNSGEDVAIQSTATDPRGIVRVELYVDNVSARVDASPTPQGQPSLTLIQTWKAVPGTHTLMVRAYTASGASSDPVAISLTVLPTAAGAGTPTYVALGPQPTISVMPTAPGAGVLLPSVIPPTSVPPTLAPPPSVPAAEPPPPPPPPACVGAPSIATFTATPATITAGSSSTLNWASVTNAESVEIDQGIGGVETPGSRSVSPASTTTFTLLARCGANTVTRQVVVTVNPPPPDVPAAPTGLSAAPSGQTTANLTWADNANNEDGFRIYRSLPGLDPQVGTAGVHAGTGNMSVNLTGLTCSETYVLYAKARKGGAESAASNYATITTDPCTPTSISSPSHTGQTITVSWTDNSSTPDETGFKIYFGSTLKKTVGATAGTGTRSTTITGLDCGATYSDIRVSAYSGARESPKSATAATRTTSPCQIKVEFTKIDVKNDTDADWAWVVNPGEIRATLTVEGATQYWPSATTYESIKSGDSHNFSRVFNTTGYRTDPLNITVHVQDLGDDPDDMGTLSQAYSGSLPLNFGAGNRTLENAYFKIYFTITVTSPP